MKIRMVLLFLAALFLMLLLGSTDVKANIAGSNVTFAPSVNGSAAAYVPNRYQTLCFKADTYSTDGEDVDTLVLKFPDDWTSYTAPTVVAASCTNGGTIDAALDWYNEADGKYTIQQFRSQEADDHCTATYCLQVVTGSDTTTDASVSWSWYSQIPYWTATGPHHPCSSDGYDGGIIGAPCDELVNPPAVVPVAAHMNLDIQPETLPVALINEGYQQQFTASGADGPYQWNWFTDNSDLGNACSFGYYTGELFCGTGTIPPGTYHFTVSVTGSGWSDGSRDYTFIVSKPLTFSPAALSTGKVGEAYNQVISAAGGTAPYTITSGDLPAGLSSATDPDAGTFTLSGIPTESGLFTVALSAVDANGVTGTRNYSLWISPTHAFTWTPDPAVENQDITFTAVPGLDRYDWMQGGQPGDTCAFNGYSIGYGQIIDNSFYTSGQFQVCLQYYVNDEVGSVEDDQWVTVVNGPPNLNLHLSPETSLPGQKVDASAYVQDGPDDGPFPCEIDWGDGTPHDTTAATSYSGCYFPAHAYSAAGSYTIQVWVSDKYGATGTQTAQYTVAYVIAEENVNWLASNVVPTTLQLVGYAIPGTKSLTFHIASPPSNGSLDAPVFSKCEGWNGQASQASSAPPRNSQVAKDKTDQTVLDKVLLAGPAVNSASPEEPVKCTATVVYTPPATDPLYEGEDPFTFTVSDGPHTSAPGNVDLWVGENHPPTAQDGSALVRGNGPGYVLLTATDPDLNDYGWVTDRLTFIIDGAPANGTIGTPTEPTCDSTYDSDYNFTGIQCTSVVAYTANPGATADSFTFHVNDTHYDSNIATISLTVHPPMTLHVNVNDDVDNGACTTTHCSLREAVLYSGPGDTIDFILSLPNTITLAGTQIMVDKDLTIRGPGADQLAISGGASTDPNDTDHGRVFAFYNSASKGLVPIQVTVSGLTIRDGRADGGAGFYSGLNSMLTMNDCVIGPNNIASYYGGGLVNSQGTLTLNRCTVMGNTSQYSYYGGGGIFATYGSTTLINSTVSGNSTNGYGGGILAWGSGTISLIHSSVSGNTANLDYEANSEGGGGGIYINGGQVSLQNSLVAGNTDLSDPATAGHPKWPDVSGAFDSSGGNLIGDGTGSTGWLASDQVGTSASPISPLLGDLQVNPPGVTPTQALLAGSPAINAAPSCAVTVDQRGVTRPQGSACDIGAFEVQAPAAFSKTSPGKGDTGVSITPTLYWGASDGAVSYEYCYYASGSCTTWNSTTALSAGLTGLSYSQTYTWQVRAVNAGGTTEANGGTYWTFTTVSPPATFKKTSPGNGATVQSANPTLSWNLSSGTPTYYYCYDTSNDNTCYSWVNNGTNTSVVLQGLSPSKTYYWQVKAVSGSSTVYADGAKTAFFSFKTSAFPAAFNKNSPSNGATGQALSLTLKWGSSSGATSYSYCYATTSGCTSWVNNGTATSVSISGLPPSTTYYWQVKADNANGTNFANGSSTAYWRFTTGSPPAGFSKSSPADTTSGLPSSVTLKWGSSSGTTTYYYCYDTTNDGACSNWASNGTSTSKTLSGLKSGTTYYWQVKAVNAVGTVYANGDLAAFWSFTTGSAPGAFGKLAPANKVTGQPTSLSLRWGASSGATRYEFCYGRINPCTNWVSVGTATSKALSGLFARSTYYWQVRAVNANGTTYADGSNTDWWFKTK